MMLLNKIAQADASVKNITRRGEARRDFLPPILEETYERYGEQYLDAGGTDFGALGAATKYQLSSWEFSAQSLGARIFGDALCHLARVKSSDGSIVYTHEDRPARSPLNFKERHGHFPEIYKTAGGSTVVIGTNKGELEDNVGRAGGAWGWSEDKNLIAGSLASFAHNFIAVLLGYFKRPSLPVDQEWKLPNLVLKETRVPNQFIPDASYKFNMVRPAATQNYIVTIDTPTRAKVGFEWWTSGKKPVARIDSVDIEEGANTIITTLRGIPPRAGYFNVNVLDAPQGLSVSEVKTRPLSV